MISNEDSKGRMTVAGAELRRIRIVTADAARERGREREREGEKIVLEAARGGRGGRFRYIRDNECTTRRSVHTYTCTEKVYV